MTVEQLRRFLNALPPGSGEWQVIALDSDTAEVSSAHKASVGTWGGSPALVLGMQIEG